MNATKTANRALAAALYAVGVTDVRPMWTAAKQAVAAGASLASIARRYAVPTEVAQAPARYAPAAPAPRKASAPKAPALTVPVTCTSRSGEEGFPGTLKVQAPRRKLVGKGTTRDWTLLKGTRAVAGGTLSAKAYLRLVAGVSVLLPVADNKLWQVQA